MKAVRTFAIPVALLALGASCAVAQYKVRPDTPISEKDLANRMPAQLVGVGIEEHLGRAIDLDLAFNDENGQAAARSCSVNPRLSGQALKRERQKRANSRT